MIRTNQIGNRLFIFALFSALNLAPALAQDWTQWRGPNRDGVVAKSDLDWSKSKATTAWTTDLGVGYSSCSVAGNSVVTMGYKDGKDEVRCFAIDSGRELWKQAYAAKNFTQMNVGGPSSTPTIVGQVVWTLSRDGQLKKLDIKTGKVLFEKDLAKSVGAPSHFGFSCSPLIIGDAMYLDLGRIVKLKVSTGEIEWQTKDFGASYSSVYKFAHDGVDFIAAFPDFGLVLVEEKTGKVVDSFEFKQKPYNVHATTPLVFQGGHRIFISAGYQRGCALLKFNGKKLTKLWSNKKLRTDMASAIMFEDSIIGVDKSQLRSVDLKTGKSRWTFRAMGNGSLIRVGTTLVCLTERGELIAAPASHKQFVPYWKLKVLKGTKCWTVPVFANNHVFCRDPYGQFVCLKVSQTGAKKSPKKEFF